MSVTAYPTLRLKLTMPTALKLQFLPAVPGFNASQVANKVDRAGDTMQGQLLLAADPTFALEAATKQYVDAHSGSGTLNPSKLAGRGSASGVGAPQEITLGTNLTMSGTTLNATGGGGGTGNVTYTASSTAPVSPAAGDLWYDLSTGVLSIRVNDGSSSQWVMVAPPGSGGTGNVSNSGTPAVGQVALWTDATHVKGVSTTTDQSTARSNIYAAPLDALAYNGMQINGSCDVSQEFGSTNTTGWLNNNGYAMDGWYSAIFQAAAGATTFSIQQVAPPGSPAFGTAFSNCLRITATAAANFAGASDRAAIFNHIEGYRWARLGFGNAAAQSVSIGFWIYASVTGTACVAVNSSGTTGRTFILEFTVTAANTWQYVTLIVPPDTTGPANWLTTNGIGASVAFCFGAGAASKGGTANVWANWTTQYATTNQSNFFATNNNAIYITGLIVLPGIEAPSAARSPLIMRPYDQELVTCKRYWQKYRVIVYPAVSAPTFTLSVEMRVAPTVSGGGAGFTIFEASNTAPTWYQTTAALQTIVLDARL